MVGLSLTITGGVAANNGTFTISGYVSPTQITFVNPLAEDGLNLVWTIPFSRKRVVTVWQIAACTQPVQLDVWADSDVERDDIMARLDTALNAGESALAGVYNPDPVGHGLLLALADGWTNSSADFYFDAPDLDDLPDSVGRSVYRATYRGDSNFMLTLSSTTARQQVIKFRAALDSYPTDDVTEVTED